MTLNKNSKIFVLNLTFIMKKIIIYIFQKVIILLLNLTNTLFTIFVKYINYINIFFLKINIYFIIQ